MEGEDQSGLAGKSENQPQNRGKMIDIFLINNNMDLISYSFSEAIRKESRIFDGI